MIMIQRLLPLKSTPPHIIVEIHLNLPTSPLSFHYHVWVGSDLEEDSGKEYNLTAMPGVTPL